MFNDYFQLGLPQCLRKRLDGSGFDKEHLSCGTLLGLVALLIICVHVADGNILNPIAVIQWLLLPPCLYMVGLYTPLLIFTFVLAALIDIYVRFFFGLV